MQLYTPVNEMYICAVFSARLGWWNEQLCGDRSFVTALKHIVKANVLAMQAILKVRPDAIFVQSESSEMYEFLLDNGMTREEYHFFLGHQLKQHCILGNDYYSTNEHRVTANGRVHASGEVFGYDEITRQHHSRCLLPVMHTETNTAQGPLGTEAVNWLWKEWANALPVRNSGVPIVGFTWYSLTDQVDWDTSLRERNGHVNPLGLFDLDRNIRPPARPRQKTTESLQP